MPSSPNLLTQAHVARRLGVSVRTMRRWRAQGMGPDWLRVGKQAVMFREDDVGRWIMRQRVKGERLQRLQGFDRLLKEFNTGLR